MNARVHCWLSFQGKIEPSQGVWSFSAADQIVNFAIAHGQIIRGHSIIWYSQLPNWVTAGAFSAAQLVAVIQEHTTTLVGHYKGKVYVLT